MNKDIKYWGIVPAAGVGRRMQADRPKQYLDLGGRKVIELTLTRLIEANVFAGIAVAISQQDPYWPELAIADHEQIIVAAGGKERADSVLSALQAIRYQAEDDDWVLVHDAARPCITVADIQLLITTLKNDSVGGILALASHDTLKTVDQLSIIETTDRSHIWRALTPQMFRYAALQDALLDAAAQGAVVTDEASALERKGQRPKIVEGRTDNIKITRPEDLSLANFYLEQQC